MNKYILLAVLALAVAAPTYAHADHHEGKSHKESTKKHKKHKKHKEMKKKKHSHKEDFKGLNK